MLLYIVQLVDGTGLHGVTGCRRCQAGLRQAECTATQAHWTNGPVTIVVARSQIACRTRCYVVLIDTRQPGDDASAPVINSSSRRCPTSPTEHSPHDNDDRLHTYLSTNDIDSFTCTLTCPHAATPSHSPRFDCSAKPKSSAFVLLIYLARPAAPLAACVQRQQCTS